MDEDFTLSMHPDLEAFFIVLLGDDNLSTSLEVLNSSLHILEALGSSRRPLPDIIALRLLQILGFRVYYKEMNGISLNLIESVQHWKSSNAEHSITAELGNYLGRVVSYFNGLEYGKLSPITP